MVITLKMRFTKKVDLTGYTLIEGFPGIGLIGTISSSYLSEKLKMEMIGCISSENFPPMATVVNGLPMCPVRIYADKKNKIAVIYSDFVIPATLVYKMVDILIDLVKNNNMKEIISLAGMTSATPLSERKIYGIASNEKVEKKLKDMNIVMIQQGITTGISGILMIESKMNAIDAFSILAESATSYPDPGAAAFLLKKLSEYLKINISTDMLEQEAKEIQTRVQRTMEQVKVGKMKYKQAEDHLPMYG